MAWSATLGCGNGQDPVEHYTLVGTWAVSESTDEGTDVPTETRIAFDADETWTLLDPGERCAAPPFQSWFCEASGFWSLPEVTAAGEVVTMVIGFDDDTLDPQTNEAHFSGDPDHFCWQMTLLGTECLLRD